MLSVPAAGEASSISLLSKDSDGMLLVGVLAWIVCFEFKMEYNGDEASWKVEEGSRSLLSKGSDGTVLTLGLIAWVVCSDLIMEACTEGSRSLLSKDAVGVGIMLVGVLLPAWIVCSEFKIEASMKVEEEGSISLLSKDDGILLGVGTMLVGVTACLEFGASMEDGSSLFSKYVGTIFTLGFGTIDR